MVEMNQKELIKLWGDWKKVDPNAEMNQKIKKDAKEFLKLYKTK
jgi:hypothetical protein